MLETFQRYIVGGLRKFLCDKLQHPAESLNLKYALIVVCQSLSQL